MATQDRDAPTAGPRPGDDAPSGDAQRDETRPHDTRSGVHRVVVIGSGFGGLFATRALAKAPVQVTLIDRTNHHLFQPLLYQLATGILSEGEIGPPIRNILRKQKNASVRLGEVTEIDVEARTVTAEFLGKTDQIGYDTLIVAAGSGQSYFGNDHFAPYAPSMKNVDDALELRARIFGAYELAETEQDPEVRDALLTFAVVGAGPTGVEMAGQLAELSRRGLKGEFRNIDPGRARVLLIEGGPAVLGGFGPKLSARAERDLGKLGVEVLTDTMVVGVDRAAIQVRDKSGATHGIPCRVKVWAAGVAASPLGAQLARATGAEATRSGQLGVEPDLSLPGHPEVFVVGDMMVLPGTLAVAQVAIQGGKYVAKVVKHRLAGKQPPPPFVYFDKGMLATISRFKAVAKIGRLQMSGFPAWVVWLAVHLMFLVGFSNRLAVTLHWTHSFIGRRRMQRTATLHQARLDPETLRTTG